MIVGARKMQRKFILSLPEDSNKDIFNLLKKIDEDNKSLADKLKSQFKQLVKIETPRDLEAKWDQCVKEVIAREPTSDVIFFTRLLEKADICFHLPSDTKRRIQISEGEEKNIIELQMNIFQEKNEDIIKLRRMIITGVVKNLLSQFVEEPDVSQCTKTLFQIVYCPREVLLGEHEFSVFKNRILSHWATIDPLLMNRLSNSINSASSHKDLIDLIGLKQSDLTHTFFTKHLILNENLTGSISIKEILTFVATYLSVQDLSQFRLVSRAHHNIIEDHSTLRIKYRLPFVTENKAYNKFIGKTIHQDDNFLLTTSRASYNNFCRLTSLKYPFTTTIIRFSSDEIIGGYVKVDEKGMINTYIASLSTPFKFNSAQMENRYHILKSSFRSLDPLIGHVSDDKCIIRLPEQFCIQSCKPSVQFTCDKEILTVNFQLESCDRDFVKLGKNTFKYRMEKIGLGFFKHYTTTISESECWNNREMECIKILG